MHHDPSPRTERLNSWLEIDAAAHAENLRIARHLIGPDVELSAVVKANAYGHGWRTIATNAIEAGADSFCVHALDEALALRNAGFSQDILVMGHVPLARLEEATAADLRLMLTNLETLETLAEITARRGSPTRVHLKLETGTYRHGVDEAGLETMLEVFHEHPWVHLEGAYTHFADIEDTTDHSYAAAQLARFEAFCARIRAAGHPLLKRHAACSAALLVFPDTHFDMVRLGISQYGFWPSKETYLSYRERHPGEPAELRPVLSWKTRVSQIKEAPAGAFVGYGRSYQTTRASRLAILPIGYSDGYDRRLSNQSWVLIRGRRAPVRGRVCMNLLIVDVTDIPDVELEDEVVLLGRQGERDITAEQLAALIGTIHYEVTTRIRADLPRLNR